MMKKIISAILHLFIILFVAAIIIIDEVLSGIHHVAYKIGKTVKKKTC
jgi:hypothetical protein